MFGLGSMAAGTLLSIGVAVLLARTDISFWWMAAPLMLNGLGMGIVGSANQTLSLQDVPPAAGGTAGGVKQTVERVGTAIGNAMITGVFFAGHALAGWTTGFVLGFSVIAVVLLLALWLARRDWIAHRPPQLA